MNTTTDMNVSKLNILISFWVLKNRTQILDEQMIRIDIILSYLQTPLVWNIAISLFNHVPQTQNIIKMRANTQNILYLKNIFLKKDTTGDRANNKDRLHREIEYHEVYTYK